MRDLRQPRRWANWDLRHPESMGRSGATVPPRWCLIGSGWQIYHDLSAMERYGKRNHLAIVS